MQCIIMYIVPTVLYGFDVNEIHDSLDKLYL